MGEKRNHKRIQEFDRCIYCFEVRESQNGCCPNCGYENGLCDMPGWWLTPGTLLKGHYLVGKPLEEQENKLTYLGYSFYENKCVEITEYFPREHITRDITVTDEISCIPGHESAFEEGKQAFFEKAKTFYKCVSRVEVLNMDFFVRNGTCYYVRTKKQENL